MGSAWHGQPAGRCHLKRIATLLESPRTGSELRPLCELAVDSGLKGLRREFQCKSQ